MNNDVRDVSLILSVVSIFGVGVYLYDPPTPPETQSSTIQYIDGIGPITIPVLYDDTPKIEPYTVPQNTIVSTAISTLVVPQVSFVLKPMTTSVALPTIPNIDDQLSAYINNDRTITPELLLTNNIPVDIQLRQLFQTNIKRMITDSRLVENDTTITISNPNMAKWVGIYETYVDTPIVFRELPVGLRMIAELRTTTHATANLRYYKSKGYTAVLIPINGLETPYQLTNLVQCVLAAGLDPWLANGGPESLTTTIYHDPEHISRLFATVAPYCKGFLPAWRRTSIHLVKQDPAYLAFFINKIRQFNPNIYIVGESYYGQTGENTPELGRHKWIARDTVVVNQSGVILSGVGVRGYAVESIMDLLFSRWKDTARVALIHGDRPYYASNNNNECSFAINLAIKQRLEQRFLRAGCAGTITTHGDVSELGRSLQTTDDIGMFPIEE